MLKPINWQKVAKRVDEGYINCLKHPTLDLWVYNYSRKCQYDSVWDNETLQCRGLIVDKDKNIIGNCLSKFWSYDQLLSFRSHTWASHILRKIGNEPFSVQDKADGSMGIVTSYQGQLITATRGSFNSDQAIKLREIIKNKYSNFKIAEDITYLGEIIYPENRIVCNYWDTEDFFLFAAIDNTTGQELDIYTLDVPFPKVERYAYQSFEELCALQPKDKEGFVVKFADNSRIKIKTEDYKLRHKIITNTNERTIWEYLSGNKPLDELLAITDDIFDAFVRKTADDLWGKFAKIRDEAEFDYDAILVKMPENLERREGRKLFAEMATKTSYPTLMFMLLDNKPIDALIWRMLEPSFPKTSFNSLAESNYDN